LPPECAKIWVTLHNLHLEVLDKKWLTYLHVLKVHQNASFRDQLDQDNSSSDEDFQLDKHQKTFGSRAPPEPAGGAWALPQTL